VISTLSTELSHSVYRLLPQQHCRFHHYEPLLLLEMLVVLNDGRATKRKRDNEGNLVSVQPQPVPVPATVQAAEAAKQPLAWQARVSALNATDTIPPRAAVSQFIELYNSAILGYRKAVRAHSNSSALRDRFIQESEAGGIPAEVSRMLKGASFTFPAIVGAEAQADDVVSSALEAMNASVAASRIATIAYLRACHDKSVEISKKLVSVQSRQENLAIDLASYAGLILADAGFPSNRWTAFINAVVLALKDELEDVSIDVHAQIYLERREKLAKASAVASAAADAEMADGTRPVQDIIAKEVATQGSASSHPCQSPSQITNSLLLRYDSVSHRSLSPEEFVEGDQCGSQQLEERSDEGQEEDQETQCEARTVPDRQRRRRGGKRKRKRKVGSQERQEGESEELEVGLTNYLSSSLLLPERLDSVLSWVSPPNVRFHRLKPETYPHLFFTASPALQREFVISRMTLLFYDTRITNRAVHNFSEIPLTPEQVKMLALNSKFAPRPKTTSVDSALTSFDDFVRRLRLSELARRKKSIQRDGYDPDIEKNQKRYIPKFHIPNPDAQAPKLLLHVEDALAKARELLETQVLSHQTMFIRPNINHKELAKLLEILKEGQVIAVPSDKNLGLCLVTAEWYCQQAWKLLINPSYTEEEPDHIALWESLEVIVTKSENLLTSQQFKWLMKPVEAQFLKVPVLKVLPKIHKIPASGRPIIPTFDTLLANASAWVDFRIKPLLARFPWIIPDSKTFCRDILNIRIPAGKEIWLVSGDVVAMYPNIPIEDGITQIATILDVSPMRFDTLEEAVELDINSLDELAVLLLRLVLKNNYVSFGGRTFRQIVGTAMGTAVAPTYANLFLAGYEVSALKEFKTALLYYGRFIDDTFAIIQGNLDTVLSFQKRFGELHPNMKMEWTQSKFQLPFLDVHVSLEVDPSVLSRSTLVQVVTRVYQKALNSYLYIPWMSCHSDASKHAWVKGELIRYVRLSSKVEDFKKIRQLFSSRLRARGYPGRWLRKIFSEVSYVEERPKALLPRPQAPISDWEPAAKLYVLKLTHNPLWEEVDFGPIWKTLRSAWVECGLGKSEDRFLASFKKPGSLGDTLNKLNGGILEALQTN
jgi:hypothetical protein